MFSLFGIMFSTACISPDFEFCQRMMSIIDKMIHPFYRTLDGCAEQDCWYRGDYFYIKADHDQLANFKLDLKRVKLAEKLKMVRLIIFEKTKDPEAKVIVYAGVYTEVQEKKLLLKQAQLPSFNGEGSKVEQDAEVWIEAMSDYFAAARTTPANQSMLSRFRLTGDAKLWWKQCCKDKGVFEGS